MAKKPATKSTSAKSKAAKSKATKKSAPAVKATPNDRNDRQHLIEVIQAGTGCTGVAARETMSALLNTIQASLKKNQKVQLAGFGTFVVSKRAARKGVNPRTGEAIKIKASKSVRFKAGRTLKEAV
jgi:DNA-binding protein HU-beta